MVTRRFPDGFLWGSATSAHQIEGGCDRNQWWAWEQEGLSTNPPKGFVNDGSTSAVACDSYHRFDEDHRLAASLGHRAYRISIEWSRIEPEQGRFDPAALDHYEAVVDSILAHGLEPTVTLHHFTHPAWAEREGGWENPAMPSWLARFAVHAVRGLGDRVKTWWTINEPTIAPTLGYLFGIHPPCVRDLSRALVVARHVLLAHGETYRAVKDAAKHPVQVGPVMQMPYHEPFDPDAALDRSRAAEADALAVGYFLRGLAEGVVPPPVGCGEEIPGLRRSYDIVGINYYLRVLVRSGPPSLGGLRRPAEPERFQDEMGWEIYPEGFYRSLLRIGALGAPVYVTENGMATRDDAARTAHLLEHLGQVWRAIQTGIDVRGYYYWSLLDNFEWAEGYARHFGLVEVDRETLARRVRPTAQVYKGIIVANALP